MVDQMRSGQLYRGEDRRLGRLGARPSVRWPYLGGLAGVAAAWALALTFPGATGSPIVPVLALAATALAIVVGTLCLGRWIVAGDTPALLLGAAVLCYGIIAIGGAELLPVLTPGVTGSAARATGTVMLVLLATGGVLAQPVDRRVRPVWLLTGSTLAVVVIGLALALLPQLADLVQGDARRPSLLLVAGPLLAVAAAGRAWQRGHWLLAGSSLLLAALALGEVTPLLTEPVGTSGAGWQGLRLVGLGCALWAALRQLLLGYRDQSARLHSTRVSLATAEDRIRAHQERAEVQAHEARSALAAIEGATQTLEHYRDRLPPATREQLATAVRGEIRRLQRLVSPAEADPVALFSPAALVAPLVAGERARGSTVTCNVPDGLVAAGRREAIADVLRALLDNARRYAPGSPVTLNGREEGDSVVLTVEDRGPGVPPEEREAIFRRGVRGTAGREVAGSGLGLFLAAELVRALGGRLWVEERQGGGASFALALPVASDAERAHLGEHGGEGVEGDLAPPLRRNDRAHA